jgi:hypothetical protein
MTGPATQYGDQSANRHWSIEDIPYVSVERDRVATNLQLFYLLASASFVEITSSLYARNLLDYFHDDAEVSAWVQRHWQREEVQHGIALRGYVKTVWPDFNWDRAYLCFYAEYSELCDAKKLGPTPALELASRCLVETGTATMYTMLYRMSSEPVLRILAAHISNDEMRHYKYFYQYFLRYYKREKTGRAAVLRTLWNRISVIDKEDAYYAFKHVFLERNPWPQFHDSDYEAFCAHYRTVARNYYPREMAVKMFLKPIGLKRWVRQITVPVLLAAASYLLT